MLENPFDPDKDQTNPEGKNKGNKLKKYLMWGIIGIVIIAIAVPLILKTSKTTGETPSSELTAITADIAALQKWRGATDESLAGLFNKIESLEIVVENIEIPEGTNWSSAIALIQTDIADLEAALSSLESDISDFENENWQPAIVVLQGKIDDIQDTVDDWIANWASNTTLVSRVEGEYVDITVQADGDYPIIVTLYGNGLKTDKVERRYPEYDIIKAWATNTVSGDVFLTIVIEHDDGWGAGDLIEIKATVGMIDYATAIVGEKQEGGGTGW